MKKCKVFDHLARVDVNYIRLAISNMLIIKVIMVSVV